MHFCDSIVVGASGGTTDLGCPVIHEPRQHIEEYVYVDFCYSRDHDPEVPGKSRQRSRSGPNVKVRQADLLQDSRRMNRPEAGG